MMDQARLPQEAYDIFWQTLEQQKEEAYGLFQEKLICSGLPVVGIRVPILRKAAKAAAKAYGVAFLSDCGMETYEERLLYGFVLTELSLADTDFMNHCDYFITQVAENWAHCDLFCTGLKKVVAEQETAFFQYAKHCLKAENPWQVRIGLVIFLTYYLKPEYIDEVLLAVAEVRSDFYYIEMAQAWLLATAWVKDAEKVRAFLAQADLSLFVKKKFVQKARDSFCVSAEDKAWLGQWRKGL